MSVQKMGLFYQLGQLPKSVPAGSASSSSASSSSGPGVSTVSAHLPASRQIPAALRFLRSVPAMSAPKGAAADKSGSAASFFSIEVFPSLSW